MGAEGAEILRQRDRAHVRQAVVDHLETVRDLQVVNAEFNASADQALEWTQKRQHALQIAFGWARRGLDLRAFLRALERERVLDEGIDLLLRYLFHFVSGY